MSGQRQVPVLVDGDVVLADSSAIARHLEQREPSPALIPGDVREAAQVQLIEDWADTTLAAAGTLCPRSGGGHGSIAACCTTPR